MPALVPGVRCHVQGGGNGYICGQSADGRHTTVRLDSGVTVRVTCRQLGGERVGKTWVD